MPRVDGTPVCNHSMISCYEAAEDGLMENELSQSLESGSAINKRGTTACNCLPSCTSINYDAEISQADFEFVKVFQSYGENYTAELPGAVLARLTIFFKEAQFITSKRSELYGLTDFMANCGGLLGKTLLIFCNQTSYNFITGLFMGVSILSLIEILYYITLRLFFNLGYRKNKIIRDRRNSMVDLDQIPGIKIDDPSNNEIQKQD